MEVDRTAEQDPVRARRARDRKHAGVLEARGYLYRARQVLVAAEDEARVGPALAERGGKPDTRRNALLAKIGLGVRQWWLPEGVPVPRTLREVRAEVKGEPVRVAVNTVLAGEPRYQGGPGGTPRASTPGHDLAKAGDEPVSLAVLDTGWAEQAGELHPALATSLRPDSDDVDALDADGDGLLDFEAGHGTFICGLAAQVAPGIVLDPERVLDPLGWGDDLTVGTALAQQRSPVVNLSLGGYSEDDRAPLAMERALAMLDREHTVVVAAAGNNASERPFWPAACKQVVAVAALDTTSGEHRPAKYSNSGPWVDVCAPGTDLRSTYVRGTWQLGPGEPAEHLDGWACWSGTSFAAPLVAAVLADKVRVSGQPARRVLRELLAGLDPLPGAPGWGLVLDPDRDLVCRDHS